MEKLDLLDCNKKLCQWAGFKLIATMLFPQDVALRKDFLLWKVICEAHERNKAGWKYSKILDENKLGHEFERYGGTQRLLQACSHNEIIKLSKKSADKGYLVGEMVFGILKFSNDPKSPTIGVNKVTKLIESVSQDKGKALKKYKPRTLLNYWAELKEVSHLWCALRIQHTEKNITNINKLRVIENVPRLLSLSEEIRKFCEAHSWHKNEPPLLEKGKTWTPPRTLKLPPVKIQTKKVEQWLLDIVKKNK